MSPIKGLDIDAFESTGPGTGNASITSKTDGWQVEYQAWLEITAPSRQSAATHFPLKRGRRPVAATGTTAVPFETKPAGSA